MDVSGISSLSTAMSQADTASEVQIAVLKKAMDIEAQGALALVQSAANSAPAANPPNLGNQVDTFA